ncbi:MAG TPA: DUF3892 domain-containing protein [Steroidobacteraceae bacterium]
MDKWADYGVSEVRFNFAHTHIDQLKINPDNGDTIGGGEMHSRAEVIDAIKRGTTFVTIFHTGSQWNKGQPVYIIRVHGQEFLKTVDNGKPIDNLDNLPEV